MADPAPHPPSCGQGDERAVELLILWSLTIVVLPFPTALLAEPGAADEAITKVLYVGTMTASSFLLGAVALIVARHAAIRDSDDVPDPGSAFAASIAFVIALVVMLAIPATTYWPLLLLIVSDRVLDLLRSMRARRGPSSRPGRR